MEIRWLRKALQDLDQEAEYIAEEDPRTARQVVQRLHHTVSLLARNPGLGVAGRVPGTRELVIPDTRYIVPYRVRPRLRRIEVLRIFHTARKPPKRW